MEALKQVYLEKCKSYSCDPIKPLVEDLAAAQGACLTSLDLKGSSKRLFNNRVSATQVFALCEALYEDANIVSIDLSYNFLDDKAAAALARLIKVNPTIRFLNLEGNDIGSQGVAELCDALQPGGSALQGLLLRANPLGDVGLDRLGQMLRVNSSLQVLDIHKTDIGIKGVIAICTALGEANSTLQVLDMGYPLIHAPQDTTILSIARMLACNSSLQDLGLAKHNMGDGQLETLVTYGLLRNSSLRRLDLHANKLSPFSGPQLERLLSECQRLVELNLAHNSLGNDGALCLARSLPYSHWLRRLDLRSNNIGEQGLIALAEALSLSQHLAEFLLWGNSLGPGACRALLDTLGQANLARLKTDLQPYEVDGRAQVALKEP